MRQWFNLTITNPDTKDLGKYLCVAENQGGVMEKEVIFTFDDPNTYYKPITDEQMTIIIGASVAVAVLFLLLLLVCCLCFCRGGRKKQQSKSKNRNGGMDHQHRSSHHHQLNNGYNGADSQRLLPNGVNGATVISSSSANPLPKPQRMGDYTNLPQSEGGYIATAQETEMQELRAPSGLSTGTRHSSSGNGSDGRPLTALSRSSYSHGHLVGEGGVASTVQLPHYNMPPDLLVKLPPPNSVSPASTSNASSNGSNGSGAASAGNAPMHTLNPAGLMMSPAQQQQFAHLLHHHQSTSPFTRSGTLPLPHQWPQHPRSVSCDHTAALSSHFTPVSAVQHQKPVLHQHHQAAAGHHARPGYVTLPRRPRTGWSLPRDTPSPGGSSVSSSAALREPIYDGVGPRTSADGSSRLNLNNSLPIQAVQPHQAHQVRQQ